MGVTCGQLDMRSFLNMFHSYPCPHTFFTSQSSLHSLKLRKKFLPCPLCNFTTQPPRDCPQAPVDSAYKTTTNAHKSLIPPLCFTALVKAVRRLTVCIELFHFLSSHVVFFQQLSYLRTIFSPFLHAPLHLTQY